MIEGLKKIDQGTIVRGNIVENGQQVEILWGSKTQRNPEGSIDAIEAIVMDSVSGLRAVRRVVSKLGHETELHGYPNDSEKATTQEKAKAYGDAMIAASSMKTSEHITDENLDETNKVDLMMIKLLSLDEIMAKLPPLFLHQTGPGNKNETAAYAALVGISLDAARRTMVLTPNSARIVGPNAGK